MLPIQVPIWNSCPFGLSVRFTRSLFGRSGDRVRDGTYPHQGTGSFQWMTVEDALQTIVACACETADIGT